MYAVRVYFFFRWAHPRGCASEQVSPSESPDRIAGKPRSSSPPAPDRDEDAGRERIIMFCTCARVCVRRKWSKSLWRFHNIYIKPFPFMIVASADRTPKTSSIILCSQRACVFMHMPRQCCLYVAFLREFTRCSHSLIIWGRRFN